MAICYAPLGLKRIVAEDLIVAQGAECAIVDQVQIPHTQLRCFQSQLQPLFTGLEGFGCLPAVADIPDGAGDELALPGLSGLRLISTGNSEPSLRRPKSSKSAPMARGRGD